MVGENIAYPNVNVLLIFRALAWPWIEACDGLRVLIVFRLTRATIEMAIFVRNRF